MNQGLGHEHSALHATRQCTQVGVGLVGEAQRHEQFIDPVVVAQQAKEARLNTQCLAHREEGVEDQFLGHHPESSAGLRRVRGHIKAHDLRAAGTRAGEPSHDLDEGGLSSAIGAQQAKEVSLLDLKADITQGTKAGVRVTVDLGHSLQTDGRRHAVGNRASTEESLASSSSAGGMPDQTS